MACFDVEVVVKMKVLNAGSGIDALNKAMDHISGKRLDQGNCTRISFGSVSAKSETG